MTTALRTTDDTEAPDAATAVRYSTFSLALDREAMAGADRVLADGTVDDRIPVVFSSEFPVERYDFWSDERYLEILDHSATSIDLSRAASGLAFVDTHNTWTVRAQLGRVEDIRLRSDRKLAGMLRLSQKQDAQDYRRDVLDGIAGEVSFGYRIDPSMVDRVVENVKGAKVVKYIVRSWMPTEVTACAVPADYTVGAYRDLHGAQHPGTPLPPPIRSAGPRADLSARAEGQPLQAPEGQEPAMDPVSTAPDSGASTTTVQVTRSEGVDLDARRTALAAEANRHGVQEVFARGVAENADLDTIGRNMMQALRERAERGPQFGGAVTLTDRDQKQFSVARAILAASGEIDSCFEREVSQQIVRNLPQGYSPKGTGVFVPTNLAAIPGLGQRAAVVAGTGTLGGNLTFVEPGSFIDLLRNKTFLLQAGATMLPGLRSSVSFPKQTAGGTFYWVGENPGSDVTESNMTFGVVSLTPKTGAATQAMSRQLLLQAEFVPEVEQLIRNDLAAIHARAIDAAGISGLGSSNQPLGLTKSTAIATIAIGTHGGVPTYDLAVDMEIAVRTGNVDGGLAYLTTPGIAGKLKKTQVFATTNGQAVWTGDLINGTLNGARAFATNQVPSNLTKGTSTTICHAIIAGAFDNLMIGEFGAAEIITDVFSKKKQGLIEVTSFQMVDIAWRYDEAFKVILDARTS